MQLASVWVWGKPSDWLRQVGTNSLVSWGFILFCWGAAALLYCPSTGADLQNSFFFLLSRKHSQWSGLFHVSFKDFIYLREKERTWERDYKPGWGIEGEANSPLSREPNAGAGSQDPKIMTWADGRCLTDWATQAQLFLFPEKNIKRKKTNKPM